MQILNFAVAVVVALSLGFVVLDDQQSFCGGYYDSPEILDADEELLWHLTAVSGLSDFVGRYNGELNQYGDALETVSSQGSIERRRCAIASMIDSKLLKTAQDTAEAVVFVEAAASGPLLKNTKGEWEGRLPIHTSYRGGVSGADTIVLSYFIDINGGGRWVFERVVFSAAEPYMNTCMEALEEVNPCLSRDTYFTPTSNSVGFIDVRRWLNKRMPLSPHVSVAHESLNFFWEALSGSNSKLQFDSFQLEHASTGLRLNDLHKVIRYPVSTQ